MTEIKELRYLIYDYCDLCDKWFDGENASDYAEDMDRIRNRSLEIIKNLEKRLDK